jgi:hypothetical protein
LTTRCGLNSAKARIQRGTVFQRGLHETKAFARREARQPRLLQARVVIVVEVVVAQHLVATIQQAVAEVEPMKPAAPVTGHAHGQSAAALTTARSASLQPTQCQSQNNHKRSSTSAWQHAA